MGLAGWARHVLIRPHRTAWGAAPATGQDQRHLTLCLTGWRSEFGGDAFWAERLGRRVAGLGGHGLWSEMAATRRAV